MVMSVAFMKESRSASPATKKAASKKNLFLSSLQKAAAFFKKFLQKPI
jgi:hypothetical protein